MRARSHRWPGAVLPSTLTHALATLGGRVLIAMSISRSARRLLVRTAVCAPTLCRTRRLTWTLTRVVVLLVGRARTALATWMNALHILARTDPRVWTAWMRTAAIVCLVGRASTARSRSLCAIVPRTTVRMRLRAHTRVLVCTHVNASVAMSALVRSARTWTSARVTLASTVRGVSRARWV